MSTPTPATLNRGIVKQVLHGDTVIIRGQPKGGPPPERTLSLSNIIAPRLARRANPTQENSVETKDEPYAWESREFMRKKLIGQMITFTVEYKVPGTGKEFGHIYLGKDTTAENVAESLVGEGLAEIRRMGIRADDEKGQKLIGLEDAAKAAGKGKWAAGTEQQHVRNVSWTLENPRHFVDSHHKKPIKAVIEHVRDGCTVRAFLIPSFHHVTIMMSGIKCPMFKLDGTTQVAEEFAEEARYFTEVRLLQRDVEIILEGESNQNLLGSIIHPAGNIAEFLLKEGFARCADWSISKVSTGADKLRAAEKVAKEKKLRLWKDYTPPPVSEIKDKNYSGKVIEVINGDALSIKVSDKDTRKVFLASIRAPRPPAEPADPEQQPKRDPKARPRPLYDIPYMFEAREFLRKKLIGKKVTVKVDYIQPANQGYPEKSCATVTIGGVNIAEALISKGYATVVRYRQGDDQRSSDYDTLLAAEDRAEKKQAGLHSKKGAPLHRVADIAGDITKAKQFLPFLQRAGKSEGIVEFVASGSRLRLYIPRETCLITFLLSGISCPRAARPAGPGGVMIPSDPFGDEALAFIRDQVLQREVEIEVETLDKGGNFIGWMYLDGTNLSVSLVENGLAKVHFTAERSVHYSALCAAEERAKSKRAALWSTYEEPKVTETPVEEPTERKVNYKPVIVTEVTDELHFYAQFVDSGPQLDKLMDQLRTEMNENPPLTGSFTPKKGGLCAAKFVDDLWYRAKVEKIEKNNIHILYIDFGNREVTDVTKLAVLPATFQTVAPQAQEFALACVILPDDPDAKADAVDQLYNDVVNKQCLLNVEIKGTGFDYVSLQFSDNKEDIGQSLISAGFVLAENRKEKRLNKLVTSYQNAQEKAKANRKNLWRYGDFTGDDAKEFGYSR